MKRKAAEGKEDDVRLKVEKVVGSVAERQSDGSCGETKTRGAVCVREMLGVSRQDLLPLAIVETSGWRVGRIRYILNFKTRAHIGDIAECADARFYSRSDISMARRNSASSSTASPLDDGAMGINVSATAGCCDRGCGADCVCVGVCACGRATDAADANGGARSSRIPSDASDRRRCGALASGCASACG
jgi:hypothetical protein